MQELDDLNARHRTFFALMDILQLHILKTKQKTPNNQQNKNRPKNLKIHPYPTNTPPQKKIKKHQPKSNPQNPTQKTPHNHIFH